MSLHTVLAGLRAAEAQAGRPAGSARLVAITKGHPMPEIEARVLAHGDFPLGENRGQELRDKAAEFAAAGKEVTWHFIGPLQRNKIKYLQPVSLVHALEAPWQAQEIARAAEKWGRAPAVLVQMHNGEAQKHGVDPAEVAGVVGEVRACGLDVRGLMVMAPDARDGADEAHIRRVFTDTARRAHDLGLGELSMGMSDDYPLAVQAGATLVRVGRSLFS